MLCCDLFLELGIEHVVCLHFVLNLELSMLFFLTVSLNLELSMLLFAFFLNLDLSMLSWGIRGSHGAGARQTGSYAFEYLSHPP